MFKRNDLEEALYNDTDLRNELSSEATNNLDTPVVGLDIEDIEVSNIGSYDEANGEGEITISGRWSGEHADSTWEGMSLSNDLTAQIEVSQDDGKFKFEVKSVEPKSPLDE